LTTETTYRDKIPREIHWNTGKPVQDEKIFNEFWNAVYQRSKDYEGGVAQSYYVLMSSGGTPQNADRAMEYLHHVHVVLSEIEVKDNNLKAIHLLEKWLEEPDEYGEKFWKEFREDLQKNRFEIS